MSLCHVSRVITRSCSSHNMASLSYSSFFCINTQSSNLAIKMLLWTKTKSSGKSPLFKPSCYRRPRE
ncbi:hypothetical protein RSAG8_13883, partial [Rhizoctonia solani AG-8 WAC10335]